MECLIADKNLMKIKKHSLTENQINSLKAEADNCLNVPINPVSNKKHFDMGNSKNDYISLGTYWWPDPKNPNGIPYMRRDGYVNPLGRDDDYFDRGRLDTLSNTLFILSNAYFYTEQEKYRDAAKKHLDAWFINSETKMNPNLEFAQAIPGHCTGRDIGIIDTVTLIEIIDSAILIDYDNIREFKNWVKDYLDWLLTSENGISEGTQGNNHGIWYDTQVISFASFIGREELVIKTAENLIKRTEQQVEKDGSFPLELGRTQSYMYSIYALRGICYGGIVAQKYGYDIFKEQLKCGTLKKCFDFIYQFAIGQKKWEYEQIKKVDKTIEPWLLTLGANALNIKDYCEFIINKSKTVIDKKGVLLRYPLSV